MSLETLLRKSADAILFGAILVIAIPVAFGYFFFNWAHELFYDSSKISIANECRGRVIGADDSSSRFVFYGEEMSGTTLLQELCVLDVRDGAIPFWEHPKGYKNEVSAGKHLIVNSRFKPLPNELAKPFVGVSLPRFQFNEQGLIVIREDVAPSVEAAVFSYAELGLTDYRFTRWPAETFATFQSGADVNFERVYLDANDYIVSIASGTQEFASFNITFDEPDARKSGLVVGNHVLITTNQKVSSYTFNGEKVAKDFCCVEHLRMLPGNSDWLISDGDELKAWRVEDLGLR